MVVSFKRVLRKGEVLFNDLTWIHRMRRSGRWDRCTCWAWSRNHLHMNFGKLLQRGKRNSVKQQKKVLRQVEDKTVHCSRYGARICPVRERKFMFCFCCLSACQLQVLYFMLELHLIQHRPWSKLHTKFKSIIFQNSNRPKSIYSQILSLSL